MDTATDDGGDVGAGLTDVVGEATPPVVRHGDLVVEHHHPRRRGRAMPMFRAAARPRPPLHRRSIVAPPVEPGRGDP
ncbi:MAG: hypothetical protein R2713_07110 [Ilumatobacteraceae bacterium]